MDFALPIYEYFINCMAVEHEEPKKCRSGSPYSGSMATDPQKGFLSTCTFSYRILLKKQLDGTKVFIVECWLCPPLKKGEMWGHRNNTEKIFPGEEQSLPAIEAWLREQFEQLMSNK